MKTSCLRLTFMLALIGRSAAATPPPAIAGPTTFRCDKRELNYLTGTFETTTVLSTNDRESAVEACRLETVRGFGRGRPRFYSVSPSGEVQFDADPGDDPGFGRVVIDKLSFELATEFSYLHMWDDDHLVGVVAFHDRYRPSLGLNAPGPSWAWSCGAMELLNYIHESERAVEIFVRDGHVFYARKLEHRLLRWPEEHPNGVTRRFVRGSSAALDLQFENQCAGSLHDFTRTWF